MAANRADIDALQTRADESNHRIGVDEDAAEEQVRRIDKVEANIALDREMIAELQAEGVLNQEHAAHLEEALRSARRIGAAMGIVMASRRVSEEVAFEVLKHASQRTNRKVRVLADELVATGDLSGVPDAR
ncbi:MAG TPA: ANTAR domain-containing protein [Propionicimonas sp.]